MRTPERRQLATLAVVTASCLFGTTGTVLQRGPAAAGALGSAAVRLLIGGATLCVVAAFDRPVAPRPWRSQMPLVLLGGVAVAVYQLCFFVGTTRTGVALATVVTIGSGPVFSGVLDSILRRRWPPRPWVLGTTIGVTGVAMLGLVGGVERVDALGVVAAFTSGLGWAVYATIAKRQIETGLDSTATMAAMFTTAAVMVSPLLFTQHVGWLSSTTGAAMAAYLGVFTVGVAYTLYGRGLRHLSAPTVITLTLAEPITAALLSVVVLDEPIGAFGWLGVAVVLAGLVVTARSGRHPGATVAD